MKSFFFVALLTFSCLMGHSLGQVPTPSPTPTPTPKPTPPAAAVVRHTPDVAWRDLFGVQRTTSEFRGRPIVVLVASDPSDKTLRRQLARIKTSYARLVGYKTALLVAFTRSNEGRLPTDMPFILAANGQKVGNDLGAGDSFRIAIIGKDGNLDYVTDKILPGQRVVDVIANSYAIQAVERNRD